MNYSKRVGKCKLKEELVIIKQRSCNNFTEIPKNIKRLNKNREKNRQKIKLANICKKCSNMDGGWCKLHKEWCSLAIKKCEKRFVHGMAVNKRNIAEN